MEKQNKRTSEAKWRVAVYFSNKGSAESFCEMLDSCNYATELELIPEKHFERMQDLIKEHKQSNG